MKIKIGWLVLLSVFGLSQVYSVWQKSIKAQKAEIETSKNEIVLDQKQLQYARIQIHKVSEENVENTLTSSGKVTFNELQVSHVFSPVSGRVTKIVAHLGDHVNKGDPLAIIDSPTLGYATADLDKSKADLNASQQNYIRQKELFEAHASSQREFEVARAEYMKAQAEYERALQKVQLLGIQHPTYVPSQEYTLRSPIEGEVMGYFLNPGTEIQGQYDGGSDQELYIVGDLDSVWVIAEIFEVNLAQIKKGDLLLVQVISYPNQIFEGEVDWVASTIDPKSRIAKVRCKIKNPQHLLRPGMYATVSIKIAKPPTLAVPRSAVLHIADQTIVFVALGKTKYGLERFERRRVLVKEDESGNWVPVIKGLKVGESVVTSGAILLSGSLK